MNDWRIHVSSLTATPDAVGWSQVHKFESDRLGEKIFFSIVITMKKGEEGIETVVLGRKILTKFQDDFFLENSVGVFNRLKTSLKNIAQEFKEVSENLEIGCATVIDKVIYLATLGTVKAFVFREGRLGKILEGKEKEITTASGYLQDGDIYILGTRRFYNKFSLNEVGSVLEDKNIEKLAENLTPRVHSEKNIGDLGALFLNITKISGIEHEKINNLHEGGLPILSKPNLAKGSLKEKFSKIRERLFDKNLYLKSENLNDQINTKRRKVALSVGFILLTLLLTSIIFGVRQKRIKDYKQGYSEELEKALHEVEEAYDIYSINPGRARGLYLEGKKRVSNLEDRGIKDSKLADLNSKLDLYQGKVLGEFTSTLDIFVDLSLLSSGFRGKKIYIYEDDIYILDTEDKKVIKVGRSNGRSEVVAGPNLVSTARNIFAYSDRVFLLLEEGVRELGSKESLIIESDWMGEVLPYAFAGNIYILEKDKPAIWRYAGTGEEYIKGNWLSENSNLNLGKAISWTIDGSIWVLEESGNILKFSQGIKRPFSLKGVPSEISDGKYIFTSDTSKHLYILVPTRNKVIVVDKEGNFKAIYTTDGLENASGIVVSEEKSKAFVLREEGLYKFDLKHLE